MPGVQCKYKFIALQHKISVQISTAELDLDGGVRVLRPQPALPALKVAPQRVLQSEPASGKPVVLLSRSATAGSAKT